MDEVTLMRIADELYGRTGIRIEPTKLSFLERRVEKRMKELSFVTATEYYRHLRYNRDAREWESFVNHCTVNETYFFREFPQLQCFAEHLLPALVAKRQRRGERKLRVWSAGCSTGEEPYTLALILREMLDQVETWEIEVVATDIDTQVLAHARRGLYSSRSVHEVPPEYLERYFTPRGDAYALGLEVKRMVRFEPLNLMEVPYKAPFQDVDFIFCRNVLIYFDDVSRKQVVDRFHDALVPGGTIFLGHSESVGRISSAFKLRKVESHLIYQKPEV